MKFESSLIIDRPPDVVWAYAADIGRHTEWMTVTDATVTSGDGARAGSRGRETMNLGPWRITADFEVAEAEPGRRLRWRTLPGAAPFDLEVLLDLAPAGTGTRASYSSSVGLRGLWRFASPMIAMEGRAGVARELRKLKQRVEGAPRPGA